MDLCQSSIGLAGPAFMVAERPPKAVFITMTSSSGSRISVSDGINFYTDKFRDINALKRKTTQWNLWRSYTAAEKDLLSKHDAVV